MRPSPNGDRKGLGVTYSPAWAARPALLGQNKYGQLSILGSIPGLFTSDVLVILYFGNEC